MLKPLASRAYTFPFPLLQQMIFSVLVATMFLVLTGCTQDPLTKYSTDTPPMIMTPFAKTGGLDGRARFREIVCAITDKRGKDLPDYRPCDEALVRLSDEPPAPGRPVNLGKSRIPIRVVVVPGLGWTCLRNFVNTKVNALTHIAKFGYAASVLEVEALSSSARNADIIRDGIARLVDTENPRPLVLIGYSKGAADIMEALTAYPELQASVVAVVTVAGAVGGSPLANDTSQSTINMLTHIPGAKCDAGDEGALESLKPAVRQRWMANHQLPDSIRYYSLVAYPDPDHISSGLKYSYNLLSQIDSRNDGQLIFFDQIIPGGTILGYINADHMAIAVPIARSHPFISAAVLNKNSFPREVLLEAILRYVEEDLALVRSHRISEL